MKLSITALIVLLAHTLPLLTNASSVPALRTPSIPKLSRVKCDVAYHTPAWFDSFSDYSPVWIEAATAIRVLEREYAEISKELTSTRHVQNAARIKFHIRHLQRKNADLFRLIESLSPIPGKLHYTKKMQLEWYYHDILRRNSESLRDTDSKIWVGGDQF
jgi:hypothetical protein